MIEFFKRILKKWSDWEDEDVFISLGPIYIETNNYTIQVIILISLVLYCFVIALAYS
jgi:hypothetical protein